MYVCMYVCVSVCLSVCLSVCMYVCRIHSSEFSSRADSDKERPISVLYLQSKGSLPEDIIKSNEGPSLTIC